MTAAILMHYWNLVQLFCRTGKGRKLVDYVAGIDWQSENMTVTKAEACCTDSDVYYFDEVERFFLVSCLALWYTKLSPILFFINSPSVHVGMPGKETIPWLKNIPLLQKV